MGEIVGAGLIAHAPTIMFSPEDRLGINDGREITLVPGIRQIRSDVLDALKPDTILVFDSHWFSTVEFLISGHASRAGKYTSEELPRGMCQIPYDLRGNPELANQVVEHVEANGVRCYACDHPYLPIHYPTVNVAHFLNRGEEWLSVSVCQTARDHNFLAVGKGIGEAIAASDRRVVLLASGAMSHRFWSLDELVDHEASDPIHIRTPEAREADYERLAWWREGKHDRVIDTMDDYRQHKPEAMFAHYLMMVAAIGGRDCRAIGRQFGEYENATGTGQVHVWFDRPQSGWC